MPLNKDTMNVFLKTRLIRNLSFLVVLFVVIILSYSRCFDFYENVLLDWRFRLRPAQNVLPNIVVIEISEDTLKQLGRWPFPRDFHASLVDVLSYCQVKQIMFDLIFTDPTTDDKVFSQSIRDSGNVYLPYVFRIGNAALSQGLPESTGYATPLLPEFDAVAKVTGHINSYTDIDGKTRWVPLFIRDETGLHPHLALTMACQLRGVPLKDIQFLDDGIVLDRAFKIPTSSTGAMLVNFAGKWKETFRHYSFADILIAVQEKLNGKAPRVKLEDLKGAICFVGFTATGTSDARPVALENDYPMVGLHANIVNSIVLNQYLVRASRWVNIFILLAFLELVFLTAFLKRNQPIEASLYILVYVVAFGGIGFWLFRFLGIWIDLFCPIVVTIFLYMALRIYNFLEESRKRQLMEKELSIAKHIQESFLPEPIEYFQGLEIAAQMIPAKHVGGDFYDMYPLGKYKFGVFIGDVAGKGVAAALIMSKTISLFRMLASGADEPSDLLYQLNEQMLLNAKSGIFVTATYLIYIAETRKLLIASAGHVETLIVRADTSHIETVSLSEGLPLGVMNHVEFSQKEIQLHQGDKVILYTDGLIEARNVRRDEFGLERLCPILRENKNGSSSDLLNTITQELTAFMGKTPIHDDYTLILLKEKGA